MSILKNTGVGMSISDDQLANIRHMDWDQLLCVRYIDHTPQWQKLIDECNQGICCVETFRDYVEFTVDSQIFINKYGDIRQGIYVVQYFPELKKVCVFIRNNPW